MKVYLNNKFINEKIHNLNLIYSNKYGAKSSAFFKYRKNVIPLQQFPNTRQLFPTFTVILADKTRGFSLSLIKFPPNSKISYYYYI